ncbi:myosin tail [Blastocladiella britannica]|nr:myosin tail [Blastocladiella britannica]
MAEESEERSQLAQEKLSKCELGLQQSQADVIRCKDALEDAERSKAQAEKTAKELTLRVLELEGTALGDGASRGASRLQARVDELTAALDKETRDKEEATRNARKAERTLKDLQLQLGESDKQKQRLAEEIEKLETKVKRLKQQADDLEASDSNLQLVKRRLERELQDSTERATRLEAESKRLKARGV